MNTSWRGLGDIVRGAAWTAMCLTAAPLFGQMTPPANPLRQPQRVTESIGPVLTAPQTAAAPIEEFAPKAASKNTLPTHEPRTVRQASYGTITPMRRPGRSALPHEKTRPVGVASRAEPELVPAPEIKSPSDKVPADGEIIYEGVFDPNVVEPGLMGTEEVIGPELAGCCDGAGCAVCCPAPCVTVCFDNMELFAGAQGFTGPMNRGSSGSFGFNEGFNWGFPLPLTYGAFGGQIGLRAAQSNLSGADFTDATRDQLFLTGGVFRRVDWGMQGGVVVDYMSQDWYANNDLVQVRGEASWVFPCAHELGFWFTVGTGQHEADSELIDNQAQTLEPWEPTDLFAFFYRRRFDETSGAEARGFAGFSGQGDGYLGADVHIPVGANWALNTNFAYLAPQETGGASGGGYAEESWNIGIGLSWYPGCHNPCGPNYFQPLLNVADNGSFMVDAR